MENQVNINEITDLKELKSLMADQFIIRENAQNQIQNSNQNIQAINTRIQEISARPVDTPEEDKTLRAKSKAK
jgi:hypothetical protein